MPPLPVRWGAQGRSDQYRCWVWSRVGELGRTTVTASATTRPGSFLGFDESYHSSPQSPLHAGTRSAPSPLPLGEGKGEGPLPLGPIPLSPRERARARVPSRALPVPASRGDPLRPIPLSPWERARVRVPPSPPNEKPPDTSTRRRAADSQERAGDGLFSARGCPPSIVGAAAFHFRVRDGNGWGHRAPITSSTQIVARLWLIRRVKSHHYHQ